MASGLGSRLFTRWICFQINSFYGTKIGLNKRKFSSVIIYNSLNLKSFWKGFWSSQYKLQVQLNRKQSNVYIYTWQKKISLEFFFLLMKTEQSYLFDRYIDWNTRQSIDKSLGTRTTLGKRHRNIDMGKIGLKKQKDRHGQYWVQYTERCPCLSFCGLCPMLPVSIFLCLVPNVARVYLSVSCAQCCPCLSFCLVPNFTSI
jgi:hypothetical protein